MTYNIIKTDNYLLVVDDSDMVGKGYRFDIIRTSVGIIDDDFFYNTRKDLFKKIISHLPLNDSPVLESVPLLPPYSRHQEDGVEQYAQSCNQLYKEWLVMGYKSGYNKAKEKYKYTEEDVFGFLSFYNSIDFNKPEYRYKHPNMDGSEREYNKTIDRKIFDKYVQSLHQYPTEFECEVELVFYPANMPKEGEDRPPYRIKTTTNSQGITEWVGKYK